jgi:peptidoglycan/xylan/chitin deacetylase (PgdA/CDA1 family)
VRRGRAPLLLLFLLTWGCAASGIRPPEVSPPVASRPVPQVIVPPSIPPAEARGFSEFIIAIVQPGDSYSSLAGKYLGDPSMDWFLSEYNGSVLPAAGQDVLIPLASYAPGGLWPKGYQTVPILTYHKLTRNGPTDAMTVREADFEEQMRFLRENGYRVISLEVLYEFLQFRRQIPARSVVITFDDGWRSVYDIAWPILKKFGYPATLFVYTDLIVGSRDTLSWDQVREMSRDGFDIEGHSKTHRYLGRKERKESFRDYFDAVRKEIVESSKILQKHTGKEVKYLAYPYGDTNALVAAVTRQEGVRLAFTVERESVPSFSNDYRVSREMIYGSFTLKDFGNNLTTFRKYNPE